ncbi:MAG: asparaginase domain-containing protein [Clostridiales bacterium]|nr:asparaginase domain-containing protein [Clostridiales bacterium]
MKISVIFTGGTIGSDYNENIISPSAYVKSRLIKRYREGKPGAEFEFVSPFTILSENLNANYLNLLLNCVKEVIKNGSRNIIICHGTDTLQYSAAALSFALAGEDVRVVFVSSNYPLSDKRANGFDNFEAAAQFLEQCKLKGVFASYKNSGEKAFIYTAVKMFSHPEAKDYVYAHGESAAWYENGIITQNPHYKSDFCGYKGSRRFSECSRVLAVSCVPGDGFYYDLTDVKAVILRPYHSGTFNTESKYFAEFCEKAFESEIPVFAVGINSGARYESFNGIESKGIIVLEPCSFPAVYIKAWLAKGSRDDIINFMKTPVCGEFSKKL